VAYPLSYRHIEEMMWERGISVDHSTINRWFLNYSPQLEQAWRGHRRPVGKSWHLDETYVKVKGEWRYFYRAVDGAGQRGRFLTHCPP
jgi:transposase-like protein